MTGEDDKGIDIDEGRRKFILDVYARLPAMTHYEALGVALAADKKAVKRAFFELVSTMHPDRYFGKNLGSYRPEMEAIYARVSAAYETLSDPEKRAAYDAAFATQPRRSSGTVRAIDPKMAQQRQAAMDALRQRFTERKSKGHEHASAGARARAAGDLSVALAEYKAALVCAPGDPMLEAAHDEVQQEMALRLVDSHRKKAQMEERFNRWAAAAESWRLILEVLPDDREAASRLQSALSKAGGAPER